MQWLEDIRRAAQHEGLSPAVDRFWFLRHGLTDSNKHQIVQGWLDTPLNAIGEQQVAAAAPILASQPISHIVASPLTRARRSAEIVAAHRGQVNIAFHDDLRERGMGELEGSGEAGRNFWEMHGPGAETLDQFARRVVRSLNTLLNRDAPLVVAHGGIRRTICAAFGIEDIHAGNAVPLCFEKVGGLWQVRRLSV